MKQQWALNVVRNKRAKLSLKQCGLKFKAMCWNLWSWVQALCPASHWICSCLPPYQLLSCTLYRANWSASYQLGFKYHVFSQFLFPICLCFSGENPHLGRGQLSIRFITYSVHMKKESVDRELSDILNKYPFVCTVYIQFIQLQTCQARQTKLACYDCQSENSLLVNLLQSQVYNYLKKNILPAKATIFVISPTLTSCLIMRTCSWVSCNLSEIDLWGKRLFLRFLSHSQRVAADRLHSMLRLKILL